MEQSKNIENDEVNNQWRHILSGKCHTYLANFMAKAFGEILSVCEKQNILTDSNSNISKIKLVDLDDISEASKLITQRFETGIKSKANPSRSLSLPLPTAIHIFINFIVFF